MSDERTTLEIIAPSVEEAVSKGLADLGLPEEAVDVEILDSGSRGIFGLGSRQARVRLTIKQMKESVTTTRVSAVAEMKAPVSSTEAVSQPTKVITKESEVEISEEDDLVEDHALTVARETVTDLLDKMKVHARVTTRYGSVENPNDEKPILVEIHGNDLSILIGRKTETLNALQYISSLIVGKELERWVPLQVDVEGYRARRERMLKQLAHRMADQAIATGRRQVLEPMPANERRVIHMELHDHPDVTTESIGDEPNRKVTIIIKSKP
jgi:spoIIIJ-associated protein